MTVATLVLMGGNYFFESTAVHEILGVVLLVLWAVHITLNRRFFLSLFKGRYNVFRILQAVVNCGILLCAIFLMVSGIMLSNHVFAWLGIESGANFARTAHLLASHWYYVFKPLGTCRRIQVKGGTCRNPRGCRSRGGLRNLRLCDSRALEIHVPATALLLL